MPNAAAPAPEGSDRSVPLHVAIIMDGNGRWAAARGLPRAEGHRRGVEALRRVVRAAHELGVLYLTIFSFSSENWSRPATEIGDLFGLLRRFIRNDLAELHGNNVRVRVIGERDGVPGAGPQKVGVPIVDLTAGMYATIAVCAALAHRAETGIGQHLDGRFLGLFQLVEQVLVVGPNTQAGTADRRDPRARCRPWTRASSPSTCRKRRASCRRRPPAATIPLGA